eukprot:scaffold1230_cov201-Alexandrium_tamarense.AAC.34
MAEELMNAHFPWSDNVPFSRRFRCRRLLFLCTAYFVRCSRPLSLMLFLTRLGSDDSRTIRTNDI